MRDLPETDSAELAVPWTGGDGISSRGVVTTVLRHEIRLLVGSFRFRASAFLLIALMALAAVTAAARYRGETLAQAEAVDEYRRRLAGTTIDHVVETLHPAIRPPWALALVADGGQTATPDVHGQALSALIAPELRRLHSGNHRLPASEPLDWLFVIRVVLSLCAFLLGYNAMCGERQTGALKLLLSYPISRWQVFTGKLLALWSCLAAPFVAGAVFSLLIAAGLGIPFQLQDLVKAGLVVLLGVWAAAFFALVALLVSSLARDSATSLIILVWLWVTAVIVVPAVSGLLAYRFHPIPTEGEIGREMKAIDQRIAQEYAGREGRWRQPEWAATDDFAWERISAAAENRRFRLKEEVRRRWMQLKVAQARLARDLASLSPTSLIQDLAERLTGSGLWRHESFLEQARAFRPVLAERLRALDARDPASPHVLFFSGWLSQRPVDPEEIPRFTFRERSVRQGLATARPVLWLFALETLALAAASLFFFSRSDAG
ncbi:MAG TPA: ABC transporter permease subunit [Thermoanaerobaculia bacterium]|nr:ABC transporter permease subunit [Thermoanaerobaculia bacterium]